MEIPWLHAATSLPPRFRFNRPFGAATDTHTKPRGVPRCPWGCCAARGAAQQAKQAWGQMGTEWGQHGDTKQTWVGKAPSAQGTRRMGIWPFASGWVLYVGWGVAFTLLQFLFAVACAMLAGISWWGIAAVVTATQKVTKVRTTTRTGDRRPPASSRLHHFVSPGVVKFAWKHLRRLRSGSLVLLR